MEAERYLNHSIKRNIGESSIDNCIRVHIDEEFDVGVIFVGVDHGFHLLTIGKLLPVMVSE